MIDESEWAETISSKIWTSPVSTAFNGKRLPMEVDWKNKGVLQGYLEELWNGLKAMRHRIHTYTKVKQV
jgi:hypothetical protein